MPATFRKILSDQFLYFSISLIAILLFSYNIHISPFTTDELSAVNRSNYDSLFDVFEFSVINDVHPPLIQVFLYFWLKIVGSNILLIKLPFLIMGIASLFLTFKLATKWFSKNTAFLALTFLGSIQFTIMYSQIARPYISGLFLCLLVAIQWTKIIEKEAKTINYFLYALFGIMSAYNHYFGTLQIAIIGLTGLFFIERKQIIKYLLTNFIIVLSYLPILSIMFQQMNYDGINYLVKPSYKYIFTYLYYIFQYSLMAVLITGSIVGYTILKTKRNLINKYTVVSLLWFLLPFIIGYFYSVMIRPVMPFRSLIFSVPFFILFLFSFSEKIKKPMLILLCGAIILVNLYALIVERNHYQMFHKGIASRAVSNTKNLIEAKYNPYILFNLESFDITFYQKKLDAEFDFDCTYDNLPNPKDFIKKINEIDNNSVVALNLPENLISIIKEHFPYAIQIDYGHNLNYYCFSKSNSVQTPPPTFDTTMVLNNNYLEDYPKNIIQDTTTNKYFYHFHEGEEWGPSLSIPIGKLVTNNYCLLESSIAILNHHEVSNGLLVFEIIDDNNSLVWRSSDTNDWLSKSNDWQNIYFSVQLNELTRKQNITPTSILKIYFWNKDKKPISIGKINLKMQEGNHLIYSLIEDFPS